MRDDDQDARDMDRHPALDDYWTPGEIAGCLYVLQWLSQTYEAFYGSPETFN